MRLRQHGNKLTAGKRLLRFDSIQQVKRCMHYHDKEATTRLGLIQLKVNRFYSINYIKCNRLRPQNNCLGVLQVSGNLMFGRFFPGFF